MFTGYGLYFLFALPALLLGLWAQFKVQSAVKKFSQVRNASGLSGSQVARRILDANGLYNVEVQESSGFLTDNYDPRNRILHLSTNVFRGVSITSAGIAAHESGHAIQHKEAYAPLNLRSMMVPTVQIGSWLGPIIFMIGLFIQSALGTQIAWVGILLFGATALFSVVTLPVELDASRRAKTWLSNTGLVMQGEEMNGVNKVLDAAALTYVAAAIQAISTVMYYAFLLMGRSRDN